jgi:hypothetical protein
MMPIHFQRVPPKGTEIQWTYMNRLYRGRVFYTDEMRYNTTHDPRMLRYARLHAIQAVAEYVWVHSDQTDAWRKGWHTKRIAGLGRWEPFTEPVKAILKLHL